MTPDGLIDQWRRGLRISHRAHYEAAKHYEHLHWWLSLPTVIISASLGTTVFASLQNANTTWVKTAMAILSVATVALTSLQGALRFAERSERHKAAAVQLGEIRRALEEQLVFTHRDEPTFAELRKKWDAADRQAPTIPSRIYNSAAKHVGDLGDTPPK
jgi:conflict system pore-forming effector with SLATT domain